jgi:hypothetical protein
MVFTSAVAAFITATLLWSVVFARNRRASFFRGAVVGALVGLVSHPPAWYLMLLFLYVSGERTSSGERTLDPVNGLWASLVYSLFSWLLVGWITALIGAAIGGSLGYLAGRVGKRPVG